MKLPFISEKQQQKETVRDGEEQEMSSKMVTAQANLESAGNFLAKYASPGLSAERYASNLLCYKLHQSITREALVYLKYIHQGAKFHQY